MKTTPTFATLADDFRAALIDTKRIGYPLDVLEPDVRARADANCRALIPDLQRSHRFVLDEDYTKFASEMSRRSPITLAKMLDLARLPFDDIWLEWPQNAREDSVVALYREDEQIPKKVGVLLNKVTITPQRTAMNIEKDTEAYRVIVVQGYEDTCGPSPVGLLLSWTDQIAPWRDEGSTDHSVLSANSAVLDEVSVGKSWMTAMQWTWPEQRALARALGAHAGIIYAPPFGLLHQEAIERARIGIFEAAATGQPSGHWHDVKARQEKWIGNCMAEITGLWRWLIAVWGLYNTGGGEFIYSTSQRQGRQPYRKAPSGVLPAYEYRIIKLKRPTTPQIVEKQLPATSSLGRREHVVQASWGHRRLATAECAKHPKVCERAIWKPVFDDEGNRVGKEQSECQICHRIRWRMPKMTRGNPALGRVDKGYEITATGSPHPSHRTVEVVDKLPPGLRIKSLPRFEAVKQQRGSPDEH